MNRLNPLYIIALVCTITFVSFFLLNDEINKYNEKIKDVDKIKVLAKNYKEYKSNWDNKKFVENTLNKILRNSSFKNQKILKTQVNKNIRIRLESSNPRVLSKFLNMVLNKKLIIKKLDINKTYIQLEVGLK